MSEFSFVDVGFDGELYTDFLENRKLKPLLKIHFSPQKAIHHDPRKTRESFKILHQKLSFGIDRLEKRSERCF